MLVREDTNHDKRFLYRCVAGDFAAAMPAHSTSNGVKGGEELYTFISTFNHVIN